MRSSLFLLVLTVFYLPQSSLSQHVAQKRTISVAKSQPVILLHPPRISTEPITFIWPPEGLPVDAKYEFILGNVAVATAPFSINGQTVTVHHDGGFLAWLPISAGTFTFHGELVLSTSNIVTNDRHIIVPAISTPVPDTPLTIDPTSLWPKSDLELRAGDTWVVRMKASRGQSARFRVGNLSWANMAEVDHQLGIYEATVIVGNKDEFNPDVIEYQIGGGWSSKSIKGKVRVAVTNKVPLIATVKTTPAGFVTTKTGPNDGYWFFPPTGCRMLVTGRNGDMLRIEPAPGIVAWVSSKDVDLSTGSVPHSKTGLIGITSSSSTVSVRIGLSERIPFDVTENDRLDTLVIRLFSAYGHTNEIVFDSGNDLIENVRWRQESTGIVAVTIRLKEGRKMWGWNARYDNGASLRIDVRKIPPINPKKPLDGIRVMLDPGHMPSAPGAIGPLGTKEMDANFAIATQTAELLKKEGAIPLLTRGTTTDEVSLGDRPRQALDRGADLFVSLHNNALPEGSNPFIKPRGFNIFYYYPHSLELARALHSHYLLHNPLPDEGLQWNNLYVTRFSAIPAVLIENAYMMLPEQEAMLNDPTFRSKLATAVVSGLKKYLAGVKEHTKR